MSSKAKNGNLRNGALILVTFGIFLILGFFRLIPIPCHGYDLFGFCLGSSGINWNPALGFAIVIVGVVILIRS